jgi:hypothetical protein
MHTVIENQMESLSIIDDAKFVRWEALRDRAMTLGARNAVDEAVLVHERRKAAGGHVLWDYLWFLIVVSMLLIGVSKLGGCDDMRDHHGEHIPSEVKGGEKDNVR